MWEQLELGSSGSRSLSLPAGAVFSSEGSTVAGDSESNMAHSHVARSGWLLAGTLTRGTFRLAVGRRPAFLTKWASPEHCLSILTMWHLAFPKQAIRESTWGASASLMKSQKPDTLTSLVSYHYKDQSYSVWERILNSRRQGSLGAIWETGHQAFAPSHSPALHLYPGVAFSMNHLPWRLCFRLCFGGKSD